MKTVIILSAQRHGTTTLCDRFNDHPEVTVLYEAFNPGEQGCLRTGVNSRTDLTEHIDAFFCDNPHLQNTFLVFKVFPRQLCSIEQLLALRYNKKFLILRRPFKDAYESYCRAMTSGNWGTTPLNQKENEKNAVVGWRAPPLAYEHYVNQLEQWFSGVENACEAAGASVDFLKFSDVVAPDFDVNQFLDF